MHVRITCTLWKKCLNNDCSPSRLGNVRDLLLKELYIVHTRFTKYCMMCNQITRWTPDTFHKKTHSCINSVMGG